MPSRKFRDFAGAALALSRISLMPGSNPQSNSGNGKFCAYCKILNHSQEECRKRMRDNKPCVNNQGKLYWPKINSAAENNDPNNVGAVFQ